MTNSNDLEIYVQRSATFRHLDQMRYQVQNVAVLLGALFSGCIASLDGRFEPVFGAIVGILLTSLGFTMLRISNGIVSNSIALKEFGEKVGDTDLPVASLGPRTATFWTTFVTFLVGIGLLGFSLAKLTGF